MSHPLSPPLRCSLLFGFGCSALAAAACSGAPATPQTVAATAQTQTPAPPPPEPGANILWKQRVDGYGSLYSGCFATNAAGELAAAAEVPDGHLLYQFDAKRTVTFRTMLSGFALNLHSIHIGSDRTTLVAAGGRGFLGLGNRPLFSMSEHGGEARELVLKLSTDGKREWASLFSEDVDSSNATLSPKGEAFIAGSFYGTARFGSTVVGGSPDAPDGGSSGLFVARLDEHGEVAWSQSIAGDGTVDAVAVDSAGSIYLSGDIKGAIAFDPAAPMRSNARSSESDSYLAKLDAKGRAVWTRRIMAERIEPSPDGSGDVYAFHHGVLRGPCALTKVAADGRVLFKLVLDEKQGVQDCGNIAVGGDGMIYVGARRPQGPEDGIRARLLKIDSTGKVVSKLDLPDGFIRELAPWLVWSAGHLVGLGEVQRTTFSEIFVAEISL